MSAKRLPGYEQVCVSITTTRWAMDQILALAKSGRYPAEFSKCADEVLRTALRQIEREGAPGTKGDENG